MSRSLQNSEVQWRRKREKNCKVQWRKKRGIRDAVSNSQREGYNAKGLPLIHKSSVKKLYCLFKSRVSALALEGHLASCMPVSYPVTFDCIVQKWERDDDEEKERLDR
ncbi:hypothetical protein E3N88_01135 [Mikania micrantha]|uniref:Uncharacterized protein n=1 Tax=Mikania micrantha TaxID=192012 RepID=A0A5N6Q056_9ASTR|nr:hypothetical protein E3N88_01135 [Mikania micrantha]